MGLWIMGSVKVWKNNLCLWALCGALKSLTKIVLSKINYCSIMLIWESKVGGFISESVEDWGGSV